MLKIYLSVQTSCHQSFMMSMLNCKELIKKYFESNAWDVLGALIAEKEQFQNWLCSTCEEGLSQYNVTLV